MNFDTLAAISIALAALPCGLFLINLFAYRPLREATPGDAPSVSVLIPARNEESNMAASLEAVLANKNADFEVVVLDDHSTDATARIVSEFAARDSRVRLEFAPAMPTGWCGKQHACHVLAQRARHAIFMFIDADVRLATDAVARAAAFMERSDAALASGVPRQELVTFGERLLIPLIHFILLGFLPMHAMRRTRWPSMSAGCGQLFIARRAAYEQCGGHAAIRDSLHDGVTLPRVFRKAGFATDLFDATDMATCRMYRTNAETWRGLGKNASEGLAAPGAIAPMTALLFAGQTLPFLMLAFAPLLSVKAIALCGSAAVLALLPRLISAARFRQPAAFALLHPFGIVALLIIQWQAFFRRLSGKPSTWKGRSYGGAIAPAQSARVKATLLLLAYIFTATNRAAESLPTATNAPISIALHDQYDAPQKLAFPATNITVLTIADRKGSEQIDGWIADLKPRYAGKIDIRGLADCAGVPSFLQGRIRKKFQEARSYSVMLDWTGKACAQLNYAPEKANLVIYDRQGQILGRFAGPATATNLHALHAILDAALEPPAPSQKSSP